MTDVVARRNPFTKLPTRDAVRECFVLPSIASISVDDRAAERLVYLIRLIHATPNHLTHSDAHKELRIAVGTLRRILPSIIEGADLEAAAAGREGRATEMQHFGGRARALLDAVQPFSSNAIDAEGKVRKDDQRRWWHGWAAMAAQDVQFVLYKHDGRHASAAGRDTVVVRVTQRLLALGGVHVGRDALLDALANRL